MRAQCLTQLLVILRFHGLVSANKHVIPLQNTPTTEEFVLMLASCVMDKLTMSPQMKAILLSFKKLPFKPNSSQDTEVTVLDSLEGEEKVVDFSIPAESLQCSSSSSWRNKVSFSRIPENNSQGCQLEKVSSTMAREKGKPTGRATSNQFKGAVLHRRRSWVVSKHILARSNTVDSLRLQKFDYNDCKERFDVSGAGAQKSLTSQTPSITKENLALEKKITPKNSSVVSNKQLSPIMNHRPQYLYRADTERVGTKPCGALINRGRDARETDNVWENMSEERKLLINKWLAPQHR